MSPPHPRALERNLLPHAGHEFGLWRREVSWKGGLSHEPQRSPGSSAAGPVSVALREMWWRKSATERLNANVVEPGVENVLLVAARLEADAGLGCIAG